MLLENKVAVVHGAGGVIGGEVARAFAREGAVVHLAGRTRAKLDAVADAITREGGVAHVAAVDALEVAAVARHAAEIVAASGRIDIAFHAVGFLHVQGTLLADLSLEDFERPIRSYMRSSFAIAKAVAAPMMAARSGVLLTLSTPASRLAFPGVLGFGATCAAIEGLARQLAGELGPSGVRVVCLRPDAIPETVTRGSSAREVFAPVAARAGTTVEAMLAENTTALLRRSPTLAEVARTAAFVASDHAGAITGQVIDLTCGVVLG